MQRSQGQLKKHTGTRSTERSGKRPQGATGVTSAEQPHPSQTLPVNTTGGIPTAPYVQALEPLPFALAALRQRTPGLLLPLAMLLQARCLSGNSPVPASKGTFCSPKASSFPPVSSGVCGGSCPARMQGCGLSWQPPVQSSSSLSIWDRTSGSDAAQSAQGQGSRGQFFQFWQELATEFLC